MLEAAESPAVKELPTFEPATVPEKANPVKNRLNYERLAAT